MTERINKLNELLKQELSRLFVLDFPAEIITINFIYTTKDLSLTKVFVFVSSGHQSVYDGLVQKANNYRRELSQKLVLRKMPKIEIIKDDMQASIDRIERILE